MVLVSGNGYDSLFSIDLSATSGCSLCSCVNAAVLARMLDVEDEQVQGSAASCLAALTVEVPSKLPVMVAAGEQLIKLLLQSSNQVCK
jgi:hypothetical protein